MGIVLPSRVNNAGKLVVQITGGRDYTDVNRLCYALDRVEEASDRQRLTMVVVEGGARGADRIGRQWAWDNNIKCITERANWAQEGRAAGPLRNQRMIDKYKPDICIAAPGGRGTADMISRCEAAGIPIIRVDSLEVR